jgi:RNA polymerase sigma-70 factor (ECF subfamily)
MVSRTTMASWSFADGEAVAPPAEILALTTGLARGDNGAWKQFHRVYGPMLFSRLLAQTRGDHDLAMESLQQTYLRVARHARPCDSVPMFRSWLTMLTRSALQDCRRRRTGFWRMLLRRQSEPDDPDGGNAAVEALHNALAKALAALSPDERTLLEGKYFLGGSVHALATQLGVTEKAVESRLTRARAELKRRLETLLHEHEKRS